MNIQESLINLWKSTGVANFILPSDPNLCGVEQFLHMFGVPIMFIVCLFLLFLGIKKQFEPLLLVPIAFGGILANIPVANMSAETGFLRLYLHCADP